MKILYISDSYNFSRGCLEFARKLNDQKPILLTALFLPQTTFASIWSYASVSNGTGSTGYFPVVPKEEREQIHRDIDLFEKACIKNGIAYRIHDIGMNIGMERLKNESRFSDLILISSENFFNADGENDKLEYIRDVVRHSECPVMILPEKAAFPESLILAYDGSENSVFSIKTFANQFPEFSKTPTMLVYADTKNDIPSEDEMIELVTRHYQDLTITKLDINAHKDFSNWIKGRKGTVLITGALGRSSISDLLRKSFASDIIKEHEIPVYIAHRS